MTTRWVALLRGIAPMNHNQKSVDLRGVCEELGFARVASVQSSGNLIFDTDTGDRDEVVRLLASYQLVTFFDEPLERGFDLPHRVEELGLDVVHATDRELFTVNDATVGKGTPSVMAWLQRTFGKDLTSRTFPTLSRILARC